MTAVPATKRPASAPPALTITPRLEALLSLPWRKSSSYLQQHLDGRLDESHQRVMRCVLDELTARGEKLNNGRPVKVTLDVIRWILEQAAQQMPVDAWSEPRRGR